MPVHCLLYNTYLGGYHCGTDDPGWMNGYHPTGQYESSQVTFCFDWDDRCYRSIRYLRKSMSIKLILLCVLIENVP